MGKKVEYRFRHKKTSDATTPLDILTDAVRVGWKRTIQRVAVEDETLACTEIRIGYKDQFGEIGWYAEQESPQAGVLYWMKDSVVLEDGDRLLIRFTGTTSADVLGVYINGFDELVG